MLSSRWFWFKSDRNIFSFYGLFHLLFCAACETNCSGDSFSVIYQHTTSDVQAARWVFWYIGWAQTCILIFHMVSRWVGSWYQNESYIMAGQSRAVAWFVNVGFQVCCVYSYFNFMVRLHNVIMFSSLKTFGECESRALELRSGPLPYLWCAHRALGKRSEAVTVERLLFHMTDFPNCSEINLWQERKAAAATGWEDWLSQRRHVSLWGFCLSGAQCEDSRLTLRVPEYHHHVHLSTKTVKRDCIYFRWLCLALVGPVSISIKMKHI